MRLVLPPRMRSSAKADARLIAEAAVKVLHAHGSSNGLVSIQIPGHGRPAQFLARDVAKAVRLQLQTRPRES